MERGETFAAITSGPDTERALALGFRVLGRSSDHLPDYPGPQCGTTRRWAAAYPDALVHFVRAMVAAIDWARQNRDATIALYRDTRGVSQRAAEEIYSTLQPDGTVNVAGIQTILDLRVALGFLEPPAPPAEQFYDPRYWEQATGRRHP
jgi:ABC-type nitrate/sulfonate/bicarbonate transport system substrate-binding protein